MAPSTSLDESQRTAELAFSRAVRKMIFDICLEVILVACELDGGVCADEVCGVVGAREGG